METINPRMYTQIHTPSVVQGGGGGCWRVDGTSPCVFDVAIFRNDFAFQWKAFDLLYKMTYILWVVALLEVCDVTKHGYRLSRLIPERN